ncbi:uncharacterized protein ACIBXB_009812 isoform 1-T2 [Morphnus guianensis]
MRSGTVLCSGAQPLRGHGGPSGVKRKRKAPLETRAGGTSDPRDPPGDGESVARSCIQPVQSPQNQAFLLSSVEEDHKAGMGNLLHAERCTGHSESLWKISESASPTKHLVL